MIKQRFILPTEWEYVASLSDTFFFSWIPDGKRADASRCTFVEGIGLRDFQLTIVELSHYLILWPYFDRRVNTSASTPDYRRGNEWCRKRSIIQATTGITWAVPFICQLLHGTMLAVEFSTSETRHRLLFVNIICWRVRIHCQPFVGIAKKNLLNAGSIFMFPIPEGMIVDADTSKSLTILSFWPRWVLKTNNRFRVAPYTTDCPIRYPSINFPWAVFIAKNGSG